MRYFSGFNKPKPLKRYYAIITFLLAGLVLLFFYHEVLLHPNDYVFAPGGDGIKNYYAYLFHARYDADFWNFGGMNYPYYEHMVYTDGHPLLSWLVACFGLADYGIGILNLLMLISYPICALFLYKILDHYGVKGWWAILAAIAITFMSPQAYRVLGHLSLSYVFAIPLMWWLIIQSLQSRRWLWSFVIMLYVLVFFFTHPYLGMILVLFGLFSWLVHTAWHRKLWKMNLLTVVFQLILPVIIFQGLVELTDTHENRIGQPSGFFQYYASWKSVFVPHDGPLNPLSSVLKIDIGNWESWNYVGFSTVIFASFILVYLVRQRKDIDFQKVLRSELAMFMLAAYLVLLFAFCFPLKYNFMRWVVDLIGPLKQFRVLGRFGWIFFYVFTVFAVVGFYKIYLRKSNKLPMIAVFSAALIFYGFEFYPVHKTISGLVSHSKNPFKIENVTPDMKALIDFTNAGKYDAIIMLPFQHMSSENILLLGSEQANYDGFVLSYHTQKPLLNSITSRMSLTEAIQFNNFFSPEFVEKELVYELPGTAKILVVKNQDFVKTDELRLIYTSEKVFENAGFNAFNFQRDKWNTTWYFDEVMQWEKQATEFLDQGWRSDTSAAFMVYESYDDQPGENFAGGGALHSFKGGYDIIYELDTKGLEPGTYTISFWYYLLADRPDVLAIAEQDSAGERKGFWFDTFDVSQSTFIVDNWCFVTLDVEVSAMIEKVNVIVSGNGNGEPFYIDELLIKNSRNKLFKRVLRDGKEYVVYDNYWLRADSYQRH